VVLNGVPGWVLRASGALPSIDMDFAHNRAWVGGSGPRAPPSLLTTTRASIEMAPWSDQHWTSFASGAPAITDLGLSVWQAATNTALQSRDMTQTAWVKTTMTTALTAAGIDNAANSATTLTATAGNATVLQTLTIGSTAETFSIFVERVTGTGNIQITENNGGTWTTMSSANCVNTQGVGTAINTTTYVRCSVEAVLANPVIGVRIVTSGDAVNVDFAQNEANTFPTPPIATTTVSVARAADGISATTTLSNLIPITTATMLFNMGAVPWGNDGTDHVLLAFLQSGSTPGVGRFSGGSINFNDGVGYRTSQAYTNGAAFRYAVAYGGTAINASLNGGTVSNYATYAGSIAGTAKPFKIGSGSGSAYWNGTFKRITVFPTVLDPVSVSALP
jgi:hypothetical protein